MQLKAFSFFVLGVALATGTAMAAQDQAPAGTAQPQQGNAMRGKRPHTTAERVDRLDKRVGGLTQDQKTKIQALFDNSQQQMLALRNDTSLTREQKHEKMTAIHQSTRSQLEQLLTPEQRAKLAAGRRQSGWRGQGKPGGSASPQSQGNPPQS